MKTPRIIILILFIITFLISSIILFFLIIDINDQNSLLNIVEKKFLNRQDKILNDYFVLNIESKTSSKTFLDLLFYLKDNSADSIFYDLNFTNLSDSDSINDIKNYIKDQKNIFSFIKINTQKGLNLFGKTSYDDITKNLIYLKTGASFTYAYYQNLLKIDNPFLISSDKIGFVYDTKSIFDNDNIDLLFKLDNKFLLNLSFLNYSFHKNLNPGEMIFSNSNSVSKNIYIYYDQKGRTSFIHNFNKPVISANNFLEWKNSLASRKDVSDNLKNLNLLKSNESGFYLYEEEENIIDNIYNISEIKDEQKKSLLTVAKNKASLWKSFKEANKKNINRKKIIIVQNGDFNWVANFIYESNIFDRGKNIKRFPISLIITASLMFFFLLLLFGSNVKKPSVFVSIIIVLIIITNILYFIFRIYLSYDFPFIELLIISLYSLLMGLLVRKVNYLIWLIEVKSIFRSNISSNMGIQIINLLRRKKWSLDSNQYISTFLTVDTKIFLQKEFQEDDIDTISQKTTEIENIIKNNNGIIDSINAGYISCYFGNPPISKDPVKDAINAANSISEIPLVLNNNSQKLKIAIHSRKEWFKYQEKYGEKYYSHFGNSYNILSALLKVANEFEIGTVISDAVYKMAGMNIPVRMFDRIKIKGLKNSLRVFELLSQKQSEDMSEMLEYFHAGLKLSEQKKWEDAGAYFRQCLKIRPNDSPSLIYLQRCKDFIYVPPMENWDGSYEVD